MAILANPSDRPQPQRSLYPACTPHHHHHLMWMGADPLASIAALGDAVYHVHAKDTRIEPNAALRTVLETLPLFTDTPAERAWNYVTLGHGHDEAFWRQFCTALTEVGYDDNLSIEHEDPTVDPIEAIRDTVDLLRRVSP